MLARIAVAALPRGLFECLRQKWAPVAGFGSCDEVRFERATFAIGSCCVAAVGAVKLQRHNRVQPLCLCYRE